VSSLHGVEFTGGQALRHSRATANESRDMPTRIARSRHESLLDLAARCWWIRRHEASSSLFLLERIAELGFWRGETLPLILMPCPRSIEL
jgi:hypothetical protein